MTVKFLNKGIAPVHAALAGTSALDDHRPKSTFHRSAEIMQRLVPALVELEKQAEILRIRPLETCEWYELLRQKLLPQLGESAFLVVAVVGGTNIGKSVIFNHLAGCRASASSPLASGTKHPVCLVPRDFGEFHQLSQVFPDFELSEWSDASAALEENQRHRLFWRTAPELPASLLILDTPDIDSDVRVNWVRADAIRRCADVLIAVLTQQKYNDAAVKEFFRKAGDEDKSVFVVFNQCLLPEDEPYWPVWLRTFCGETGIRPDAVYLAPNDRRSAEQLRLPFYDRTRSAREFLQRADETSDNVSDSTPPDETCPADTSPISSGDFPGATSSPRPASHPADDIPDQPRSLSTDLARLRFAEIRMRTLLGSLRELTHAQRGLPAWLREIRSESEDLSRTASRLSADGVIQIRNWPAPMNSAVVREIREWWQERQEGWARRINSAYSAVGNGLLWPVRAARKYFQGDTADPPDNYRDREWSVILNVVEELFERLRWMADSGNDVIRPRIERLLDGDSRASLLKSLEHQHSQTDPDQELKTVVDEQLRLLQHSRPELFGLYRQLNNVSAAVRPVTSIVLFSVGFGPAGELVAPVLGHAAASAAVHIFADVAGGATAAIAGEAAVATAAGSGAGLLQAWFHKLHSAFTKRRVEWLTQQIHSQLLGDLPQTLLRAAEITAGPAFAEVQYCASELQSILSGEGPIDTTI